MHPTILALDASSTTIGYCLYDGAVLALGEIALKHADIAERCHLAQCELTTLLLRYPAIDALALESPAAVHMKGLIPQCRVSGALLAGAAQQSIPVVEVTPGQAKRALTTCGTATKRMMIERAALQFGYSLESLTIAPRHGTLYAMLDGVAVYGEHAADALGVALAAQARVQVVPV